ncbi:hypothetical protein H1R20_g1562, partial [Candolleomyces eurysporus]
MLQQKLQMGIKVKDHVPSYGDRPNDLAPVVTYFRAEFEQVAAGRHFDTFIDVNIGAIQGIIGIDSSF